MPQARRPNARAGTTHRGRRRRRGCPALGSPLLAASLHEAYDRLVDQFGLQRAEVDPAQLLSLEDIHVGDAQLGLEAAWRAVSILNFVIRTGVT
jgi:hypothetical protein